MFKLFGLKPLKDIFIKFSHIILKLVNNLSYSASIALPTNLGKQEFVGP